MALRMDLFKTIMKIKTSSLPVLDCAQNPN